MLYEVITVIGETVKVIDGPFNNFSGVIVITSYSIHYTKLYDEQSPYLNNWKGTNQHGDLLQEGTYFVILRIGGIEKAFTGYIDLRR